MVAACLPDCVPVSVPVWVPDCLPDCETLWVSDWDVGCSAVNLRLLASTAFWSAELL